ncbi:hypothetical protein C5B96_00890, partial [Subtercola sp. Z020]|uniref:helix-turn-helix domain-containing protein n=1 Tax=Subtercola sp. Z020 TaxID=2080582 RepID=UPI000CE7E1AC
MPLLRERAAEAVDPAAAKRIGVALAGIHSGGTDGDTTTAGPNGTIVVDGVPVAVPAGVRDAVVDLLQRFADGQSVVVGSTDALLTTSQAAELLGISATYLLRLANEGTIPVEYRGTHRRFRLADAMAYLEASRAAKAARAAARPPAP